MKDDGEGKSENQDEAAQSLQSDEGPLLAEMFDLEQWEAEAPPADFAERVLARVRAEDERKPNSDSSNARPSADKRAPLSRRWAVTGVVATSAIAAGVLLRIFFGGPPSHGEAIAKERIEVPLGSRALAVLEPGANVRWNGDDVVQPRGDVFYRVEPGARFKVHTPAGDVEVKGTCFTVKVRSSVAAAGEAPSMSASALAFVAVYEGKVAVSRATEHVDLVAGETAQSGVEGVKRTTGTAAEGEKEFDRKAAALASADNDPADKANQNLVRQVGEYRSRLDAITAQKTELEGKLKRSEERLAAAQDGSAPRIRHGFDLTPDDWKELSKSNTIKFRMPCTAHRSPLPFQPNQEQTTALGLQPSDAIVIRDAYGRSNKRVWDAIKPLCAATIGSADVAERIGPDTCIHLVLDYEEDRDAKAAKEAKHQVTEIRAGLRPLPGPNDKVHPVTKLFLAATGESANLEADLAQSYGPDEAHRLVFSDELCFGSSIFGRNSGD